MFKASLAVILSVILMAQPVLASEVLSGNPIKQIPGKSADNFAQAVRQNEQHLEGAAELLELQNKPLANIKPSLNEPIIITGGDIVFNQTGNVVLISSTVNLRAAVRFNLKEPNTIEFGNTVFGGAIVPYNRDSAPGSWAQVMDIAIQMAEQLATATASPQDQKLLQKVIKSLKQDYAQTLSIDSGSGFDRVVVSVIGGMIQVTAPYPSPFNGGYFTYNRKSGIVSEGHSQYAGNFPVSAELLNRMIAQVQKAISLLTDPAQVRELNRVLNTLNHDLRKLSLI